MLSDDSMFFFLLTLSVNSVYFKSELQIQRKKNPGALQCVNICKWILMFIFSSLINLLQTEGYGAKVTVVRNEGSRLDNPTQQNDKAPPLSQSFTPVSYQSFGLKSNLYNWGIHLLN